MTSLTPPAARTIAERTAFGVVIVDKPPGPSSHQVASWVGSLLEVDRAAHTGTLDPSVTGCLPVLLGRATRIARVLVSGKKTYVAVLELHGPPPDRLHDVLEEFETELYQKPPRKSAVARRLRTREIFELTPLEVIERRILLRIRCESGTYIRKLCHDLGLAMGVGGHMADLRRIETPPFDDRDLVTLHELADAIADANAGESGDLDRILHPAERALAHLPRVTVSPSAARTIAHGSPVYAPGVIESDVSTPGERPLIACYTPDGTAICLGRLVGDPGAETGEVVALERVLVAES